MKVKGRKIGLWGLLLLLMLFAAGFTSQVTTKDVQAAQEGFVTVNGKVYYMLSNGQYKKGWLTLNGKKYYFDLTTGVRMSGFTKISNKTYYFAASTGVMATGWVSNAKGQKRYFGTDGVMRTGWQTFSGKKRYFSASSGIMATGWVSNAKGQKRYFGTDGYMRTGWVSNSDGQKRYFSTSSGIMATGWVKNGSGKYRYFNTSTGIMYTGWYTDNNKQMRYFSTSSGIMATGWVKNGSGKYRYFSTSNGIMTTGWVKNGSGKYRYFSKTNGIMATGWVSDSTGKRYFDTSTGYMATGTMVIDGKSYVFNSSGYVTSEENLSLTTPTNERTIKNYLAGAIQPVGQALYVWGGGWNDSTLKGVSSTWREFYYSQDEDYDYQENGLNDLSAANRAKGLDCSGFVGWATYQVFHSTSGEGYGYTVVANDVGSYYKSKGWGTTLTQSQLKAASYTLKPGDVGYNSGHTWIVIGQCSDKSVVIVHSTPNAGCQLSGTTTPDGDYSSQAITLAKKYMSKYSGYTKYDYHTSAGNYIKNGNYFRWDSSILSDPDGYLNKTADQILADLYN